MRLVRGAQPRSTFGKCANPNWHGHNYELHVTIKGVPAEETGYCMDLKDLRDIIKERGRSPSGPPQPQPRRALDARVAEDLH